MKSRASCPPSGKTFQQADNVQVGVDTDSMLMVTEYVTQHANDKQEVEPTLKALEETAETLGKPDALLSDNGYFSETNVNSCVAAASTPYIAPGREAHHLPVEQRWTSPPPLAADANAVDEMKHRMTTPEGRAVYAQRNPPSNLCTDRQIRVGFSPVSLARLEERVWRMDTGQHRLESEAAIPSAPATNATAGLQRPETRPR